MTKEQGSEIAVSRSQSIKEDEMAKEKEAPKRLSRRQFVKGAAAVAGAGALAGCAPAATPAAAPTCPPCPTPPAGVPEEGAWDVPPPPIPASDIKETITADVVVVGSGTAGLTATVSAAEAGAKVILLEKLDTFRFGGGDNTAIGSRLQKELGIEIDKELVIRELMRWGGNKPDQRLIRQWADNCGKVMDWILDMTDAAGIEPSIKQWPGPEGAYDFAAEYYGQVPSCHNFSLNGVAGQAILLQALTDNALTLGADIRYETPAVQLVREGNGRVTGVIAQTKEGDYAQFNANKAVLLCTGDYGSNPEMMEKLCPWGADLAKNNMIPGNTGDGHKMAVWVGGMMELVPHAPMTHGSGPLGADAHLQVNRLGERFQNEDVPGQPACNAAQRQPGGGFFQVWDAKWEEEAPKMGVGLGKIYWPTQADRDKLQAKIEAGTVLTADTVEELAQKMEVPVETFKATVERNNELARMGVDLDFGKRPDRLTTVEKPPLMAGWGGPRFLVVLGGLYVNPKLQGLDAEWKVIPGLYLAGNTVGNFYANDYPTMLPGLSHSRALTDGYIAGKNAAAETV